MSYFASFEDALDEFVSDVIIEDGCPELPGSGDWSIFRDHVDGDFYLSSVKDDYRDECMISVRDASDLGMYCEFSLGEIAEARRWLYDEILRCVEY